MRFWGITHDATLVINVGAQGTYSIRGCHYQHAFIIVKGSSPLLSALASRPLSTGEIQHGASQRRELVGGGPRLQARHHGHGIKARRLEHPTFPLLGSSSSWRDGRGWRSSRCTTEPSSAERAGKLYKKMALHCSLSDLKTTVRLSVRETTLLQVAKATKCFRGFWAFFILFATAYRGTQKRLTVRVRDGALDVVGTCYRSVIQNALLKS